MPLPCSTRTLILAFLAALFSSPAIGFEFVENGGQTDPSVAFSARGEEFSGWFGDTEIDLLFRDERSSHALELTFLDARKEVVVRGSGPTGAAHSFYTRSNGTTTGVSGVRGFERVVYQDLYPGIDLIYYEHRGQLKSDFLVRPGADPSSIRFRYDGATDIHVDAAGNLLIGTSLGPITETAPPAYQGTNRVDAAYAVDNEGNISFELGDYDPDQTLVIDPLLGSTFIGAPNPDVIRGLTVDGSGNAYVVGYTLSSTFPKTPGAYDETHNGAYDCFVAKFSGDLSTLLASTLIGSDNADYGMCIAIDAQGDVIVAGHTLSDTFPTTLGTYDQTFNGEVDNFLVEFDSDLATLQRSTLFGGGGVDNVFPNSLTIAPNGSIYVAGVTYSGDYPTTIGAFDTDPNGTQDGALSRFDAAMTTLEASTYLGGNAIDAIFSPALDANGNVFVAGYAVSTNFPTTIGAYDTSHNGGFDSIVACLDADLTTLVASSFIGGAANGDAAVVDLDAAGNVYLFGTTESSTFPTTVGAFAEAHSGGADAFIARLSNDLGTLQRSTFLGGTSFERARAMTVDAEGNVYISGVTASAGFPTTAGAFDESHNGDTDGFVALLDGELATLTASTFIGGAGDEEGDSMNCLELDSIGSVFVSGTTDSENFPTSEGAFDESHNGGEDGFVSKLDPLLSSLDPASAPDFEPTTKPARLLASYPNPASSGASLDFFLPQQDAIRLTVRNVEGKTVRVLTESQLPAGHHSFHWDRLDASGAPVPSGVYFYSLEGNGWRETRKLQIVRGR